MEMTWRDKSLAAIHIKFTRCRAESPQRTVSDIMKEIKPLAYKVFGNTHPTKIWRKACDDYERDAKKMYEL
ncbi:MAG: hypothetical protein M3Q99_16840 [Acidobacteriota bacterium]|nr:hypothetical protein [Acidobacteriota bacterium]